MRHEDVRVHDGDQLMQKVRLKLKQLWRQLFHHLLESLSCHRGNPIPRFRLTPGEDTLLISVEQRLCTSR